MVILFLLHNCSERAEAEQHIGSGSHKRAPLARTHITHASTRIATIGLDLARGGAVPQKALRHGQVLGRGELDVGVLPHRQLHLSCVFEYIQGLERQWGVGIRCRTRAACVRAYREADHLHHGHVVRHIQPVNECMN